ncbi:MAG: TIR domain-containing protein [Candidatus Brocadiales bacterium]|nr:TIR domain-containing protein [Candidatus Brocadiales bacterium]
MARKKSSKLNEKHVKVLQILESYTTEFGYPPTIREIMERTQLSSTSVVNYYLEQLEEKGYLERERGVIRGLRIIKDYSTQISVPLHAQKEVQIVPRVFISYAKEDLLAAKEIYEYLQKNGFSPWMDKYNLFPGQNWDLEIRAEIHRSDYIIICLSQNSVSKRGYFQKELRIALLAAEEMPEDDILIIPTRIEECDVPSSLLSRHYLDWYLPGWEDELLRVFNRPTFSERFVKTSRFVHQNTPLEFVISSLSMGKSIDEIITSLIYGFDLRPTKAEELYNMGYQKWLKM